MTGLQRPARSAPTRPTTTVLILSMHDDERYLLKR